MKEFDYEKAKAGARVCIRDGRPARIVCWDAKGDNYPILAFDMAEHAEELMMATRKREGWVIINRWTDFFAYFDTIESANAALLDVENNISTSTGITGEYIVVHIEWEEEK